MSSIDQYEYDAAIGQLIVRFSTGRVFVYENVPQETYELFASSDAQGSYFNDNIRDKYPFKEH